MVLACTTIPRVGTVWVSTITIHKKSWYHPLYQYFNPCFKAIQPISLSADGQPVLYGQLLKHLRLLTKLDAMAFT